MIIPNLNFIIMLLDCLLLLRRGVVNNSQMGDLYMLSSKIDSVPFLFNTLEPANHLKIPAGIYELRKCRSPKLKLDVLVILSVKGRIGIEFHPGNFYADTEGCILPGYKIDDHLICSFESFTLLMSLYERQLFTRIEIVD